MEPVKADEQIEPVHPLPRLAKDAVEAYVLERAIISPPLDPAPEMRERAGVFVCLKRRGELRGCIGTFEPAEGNVALEVIRNAIAAATRDPRFPPVSPSELPTLHYTVDVLTPPERILAPDDLDVKRFGVIVQSGARRGLLLPDLDGVDSVAQQIEIACRKAGIAAGQPMQLFRFEVRRYT